DPFIRCPTQNVRTIRPCAGAPTAAVKTPALHALGLDLRSSPGALAGDATPPAFPETEAPTARSGQRLSGTFPARLDPATAWVLNVRTGSAPSCAARCGG